MPLPNSIDTMKLGAAGTRHINQPLQVLIMMEARSEKNLSVAIANFKSVVSCFQLSNHVFFLSVVLFYEKC